jgi:hypothetical protein
MAWDPRPPEGTRAGKGGSERRPRGAGRSPWWYVRPAVRARSTHAGHAVAAIALTAVIGCGGGESQDANEPSGDFEVEVVDASFPKVQKLGKSSDLVLTVRNSGNEDVPNLAVTVNGFSYRREETDLSDPNRPRFAVNGLPVEIGGFPEARDAAPRGCDTAYVNTWACGPLAPDKERTLRWTVTAVVTGPFKIDYRVAAGLHGKAKAVVTGGGAPEGSFTGVVSDKPNHTLIGPDGKTVVTD